MDSAGRSYPAMGACLREVPVGSWCIPFAMTSQYPTGCHIATFSHGEKKENRDGVPASLSTIEWLAVRVHDQRMPRRDGSRLPFGLVVVHVHGLRLDPDDLFTSCLCLFWHASKRLLCGVVRRTGVKRVCLSPLVPLDQCACGHDGPRVPGCPAEGFGRKAGALLHRAVACSRICCVGAREPFPGGEPRTNRQITWAFQKRVAISFRVAPR